MNLSTANESFRRLIGSDISYSIPPYQRDYSWQDENWEELWADIVAMFDDDDETEHYMGYLVLQSGKNKNAWVIDGQQRLTTISLIILAALSRLKKLINENIDPDKNKQREALLRDNYIGYIDPVTLTARSKLILNRQNNRYYQSYLATNAEHIPSRGLKASEHLLRKAYQWYEKRFEERFVASPDLGQDLSAFIDSMVDKLFFTVITVTDELNAFKVFETLNARGVRLSSTDLLKNYLFSLVNDDDTHEITLDTLEKEWEVIIGKLESESFPELLRLFWNSKNRLVRKKDLFKVVKKAITTKKQTFELIRELNYNVEIYTHLRDINNSAWTKKESDALSQLQIFNVRQPLAMLMSSYRAFYETNRPLFTRVLEAIATLSFRYNVICSLPPQDQEGVYSKVAILIERKELTDIQSIHHALKPIYPNDEQFKASFMNKTLKTTNSRNQKVVQYILQAIETQASGLAVDLSADRYTIEHILPQNPDASWTSFKDNEIDNYIYRLGNMTLLEKNINQSVGNKSFEQKRERYQNSQIGITKHIGLNNEKWSPETINSKQTYLAKQATTIWKIQF